MRYFLVALSFVAGVVATGLVLNVTRSNAQSDAGLITEFTSSNVKNAIAAAGGEYLKTSTSDTGAQLVYFNYGGRKYFAGIICTTENKVCYGLELVASFGTKGVTIPLETVNAYNYNYVSGKAIFVASTPALDTARFLSAVGGIAPANLVWEIKNFHARTDNLLEDLRKASVIASTATPAAPTFAPTSAPMAGGASQAHVAHAPQNALPR
jgi:hypothetical protein